MTPSTCPVPEIRQLQDQLSAAQASAKSATQQLEQQIALNDQLNVKIAEQDKILKSLEEFKQQEPDYFTKSIADILGIAHDTQTDIQNLQMEIVAKLTETNNSFVELQQKHKKQLELYDKLLRDHEQIVLELRRKPEDATELVEFFELSLRQTENQAAKYLQECKELRAKLADANRENSALRLQLADHKDAAAQGELS